MRGKQVVILGLARQGTAMARFLVGQGARVIISDLKPAAALASYLETLRGLPIRYVLGEHPLSLLEGTDLLCLSGGVPPDIPIVREAVRRGIPLSNDAQLFLERCPGLVIGITGSSGKTTTTALVGRMLQRGRFLTWVGGNIGRPLVDHLFEMKPTDRVALELSSFQLELMTVSPEVAAVLNITPNHLDRHKTMEAYTAAKAHILTFQGPGDVALLGYDDPGARALAPLVRGRLLYFSLQEPVEEGAFLRGDQVVVRLDGRERVVCSTSEIRLLGRHNVLNVLAASALAAVVRVPLEAIREITTTFRGVPHRLQLVREMRGVRYYDDSIATAPERTVAALRSFDEPIVLLAGGRDKDLPWEEMARLTWQKVRHLITFGEAAAMIERVVREAAPSNGGESPLLEGITRVETLEEAVEVAARIARPGEVVLLSPGGTSFDAFRDFAERGDRFQELVRELE